MLGFVSSAQCTAKLDGRQAGRESSTTGIASAASSPDSYAMNSHYDIPKTAGDAVAEPSATDGREALRILRSLADGKHPFTGEPLPDESCYQSAKVLRALLAGIEALEKATDRKSRKLPAGAGKPWDTEEDRALVADFEGGAAIADLAQNHQRTEGAIRSRLMKLGKLQPPGGGV